MGIAVDESTKSEDLRKYDSWFQLAFGTGEVLDLQDKIFSMWEQKEVKGQHLKMAKLDPQVDMKFKSRKSDLVVEELAKDRKWALQGIKDDRLLINTILSRVAAKECSLNKMITEFQKLVDFLYYCLCLDCFLNLLLILTFMCNVF